MCLPSVLEFEGIIVRGYWFPDGGGPEGGGVLVYKHFVCGNSLSSKLVLAAAWVAICSFDSIVWARGLTRCKWICKNILCVWWALISECYFPHEQGAVLK